MCNLCNDFNKELNEAVEKQSKKMKSFTKEEAKSFLQASGILDELGNLRKEFQNSDEKSSK